MAWTRWDKRELVLVAARFPRDDYERLQKSAAKNLRSVGKECAMLALSALQEQDREKEKQKQQVG